MKSSLIFVILCAGIRAYEEDVPRFFTNGHAGFQFFHAQDNDNHQQHRKPVTQTGNELNGFKTIKRPQFVYTNSIRRKDQVANVDYVNGKNDDLRSDSSKEVANVLDSTTKKTPQTITVDGIDSSSSTRRTTSSTTAPSRVEDLLVSEPCTIAANEPKDKSQSKHNRLNVKLIARNQSRITTRLPSVKSTTVKNLVITTEPHEFSSQGVIKVTVLRDEPEVVTRRVSLKSTTTDDNKVPIATTEVTRKMPHVENETFKLTTLTIDKPETATTETSPKPTTATTMKPTVIKKNTSTTARPKTVTRRKTNNNNLRTTTTTESPSSLKTPEVDNDIIATTTSKPTTPKVTRTKFFNRNQNKFVPKPQENSVLNRVEVMEKRKKIYTGYIRKFNTTASANPTRKPITRRTVPTPPHKFFARTTLSTMTTSRSTLKPNKDLYARKPSEKFMQLRQGNKEKSQVEDGISALRKRHLNSLNYFRQHSLNFAKH
ncbi:PREDICTED: mucin-5AC-like [Nicrophorus vespilloides]|uniref:Mucin-5AC-like n=1 Tax=Nicrophorus vespilloides TaxID=110193 RepID=A0ABM1MBA7_NICVS|nr:PREDICTED: mucin-5AC-like [Nicrophorus vespilloides]